MPDKKIYETIIIGAGPAGLTAGRYLNDALILDKKKEIGKPVQCGEGISKKTLEMLDIKPNVAWISSTIHKIERIMPNNKVIGKYNNKPLGYVLDREKFENALCQQLKAEIRLNTEVMDVNLKSDLWEVVAKNGDVFKSKYIIGADGPASIVRQKIFLEKIKFIPALEYLVETEKELDATAIKIYLDNEKYKDGYAWIFPKSKNTANIGVDGKGNLLVKIYKFLNENIKRKYGNYKILENRSGTISFKNKDTTLCKNNAMLVGDAAGLADPIFHGGIGQAMFSGKISAECILNKEINLYEEKIKAMSFNNDNLNKASAILYSLDNRTLNDLGDILEGKGFSHIKTFAGILKILSKKSLAINIVNFIVFFSAIKNNKEFI